jgi:hypothetical protein
LFTISRDDVEEGVFKIHSEKYPNLVMGLAAGDNCENNNSILFALDINQPFQKWNINKDGSIESVHCQNFVLDIVEVEISADVFEQKLEAHETKDKNTWSQEWSVKSSNMILMQTSVSGEDPNRNQTFRTIFIDPGFDVGLHPGFPGDMEVVRGQQCLSSAMDRDLAKRAMHICDESMSFLVGSQMSIGTLKEITDLVETKGANRMPGYCCMDVATNSEFLGYDVS